MTCDLVKDIIGVGGCASMCGAEKKERALAHFCRGDDATTTTPAGSSSSSSSWWPFHWGSAQTLLAEDQCMASCPQDVAPNCSLVKEIIKSGGCAEQCTQEKKDLAIKHFCEEPSGWLHPSSWFQHGTGLHMPAIPGTHWLHWLISVHFDTGGGGNYGKKRHHHNGGSHKNQYISSRANSYVGSDSNPIELNDLNPNDPCMASCKLDGKMTCSKIFDAFDGGCADKCSAEKKQAALKTFCKDER